jgi:hypothetical protein
MVSSRRTFLRAVGGTVGLAAGAGVVSARGDDDHPRRNARLRVLHASPDAPRVDIFVDDGRVLKGVKFTEISPYLPLPAGEYNVKVVPSSAKGDLHAAVIDADVELLPYRDYTVAAVNRLADIAPLVLLDRNFFAPRQRARVRVVHLSPDAPAVDVAVKDGPVVFDDVEYLESDYELVRPGRYTVEVRPAGTRRVAGEFRLPRLAGETIYSVFALGLLHPDNRRQAFTLKPVVDSEGGFFSRFDWDEYDRDDH